MCSWGGAGRCLGGAALREWLGSLAAWTLVLFSLLTALMPPAQFAHLAAAPLWFRYFLRDFPFPSLFALDQNCQQTPLAPRKTGYGSPATSCPFLIKAWEEGGWLCPRSWTGTLSEVAGLSRRTQTIPQDISSRQVPRWSHQDKDKPLRNPV